MAQPAGHVHVSEREVAHTWPDGQKDDARWEDCAWCSSVMFARWCRNPRIPATHAEAELLRDAAGEPPLGGSNVDDLLRGLKARYGWTPPVRVNTAGLWQKLTPGSGVVVSGKMGAFPAGHNLRRWDPGFTGGHSIFAIRVDTQDRVWWDDPLAPKGTYQGQWVSKADLIRFATALGSTHLVAPKYSQEEVVKAITSEAPVTMDIANGAIVYKLDGVTKLATMSAASKGRLSPFACGTQRGAYFTVGGVRQLGLVTPVAGTVKPIVDTTPYTQAQVDAAKVAGTEAGKSAEAVRIRAELEQEHLDLLVRLGL